MLIDGGEEFHSPSRRNDVSVIFEPYVEVQIHGVVTLPVGGLEAGRVGKARLCGSDGVDEFVDELIPVVIGIEDSVEGDR